MAIKTFYIVIAAIAIVVFQAFALWYLLGNSFICPCNQVKIWDGTVWGPQNSQHLFDWYSFSHVIYGFVLYFFLWLARKKFSWVSIGIAFLLVLAASVAWEVFENTNYAVSHFHANTISFDYRGDSVVNSIVDTLIMAVGFWLAYKLPWWIITAIAIVLEIVVAYNIRDNFVLSIIMFLNPLDAILQWQKAALTP